MIHEVPALFLAHGSPMLAVEQTPYADFLGELGRRIRPKAIVIFTAHWESDFPTVSFKDDAYDTIYDFYGFPPELYAVRYPARGSKEIAGIVEERLKGKGFEVRRDTERGLDHGSWTLLFRMYPKADIPVVQVSVNPRWSPSEQHRLGEALRGLGEEGVLVIGSGVTVHNLRIIKWGQLEPETWAVEFDDWLIGKVAAKDFGALDGYLQKAPHGPMAVPTPEHFVPLFIAMGSATPEATARVIHRSYMFGTLSNLSCEFS